MKNIWKLSLYRLKKDKNQYLLLSFILMLTAVIISLAFAIYLNIDQSYSILFDSLNTANIDIAIMKEQDNEVYKKDIEHMEGITFVEVREGVLDAAIAKDFRGTDFDMQTIFYNINNTHTLNQIDILERDSSQTIGIYLPIFIADFGEYSIGETITYSIEDTNYTFLIAGKVQEMQYGNYGTGTISVFLSDELYSSFEKENKANKISVYSIKIQEGKNSEEIEKEITDYFYNQGIYVLNSNHDSATKALRTMVSNLTSMILFVFAIIVLFVSLALSKFRISNTIEMETENMGVLKAIGYTSDSIILTLIIPYMVACMIAVALGLILSSFLLPLVAEMLGMQAGMVLNIHIDAVACLLTLFVLGSMTLLFTYSGVKKIRKLQPVVAIREVSMGGSKKQNVLIIIVLFSVTVLMSFAGTLFYNIVIETDNFASTLAEETPSIIINTSENNIESIKEGLLSMEEVEKLISYSNKKVEINNMNIQAFVSEDFTQVANDLCYEGRNPAEYNEIAIGSSIVKNGDYNIGDIITVINGHQQQEYTIVGFVQSINYQGNICELTTGGYAKLSSNEIDTTQYLYAKEGTDIEALIHAIETKYKEDIVQIINYDKLSRATNNIYISGIKIVVIILLFTILFIIILVLFIVIRSLIIQQRKELGIYKAIGYTNKQLRLRIAGSFLPTAIPTILFTALLGRIYMMITYNVLFKNLGAMRHHLEVPIIVLLIVAMILVILTFNISFLLTGPIKKISVCSLIRE